MRWGIDDTDSPRGGCTTWVLTELAGLARDDGLDLLGEPQLVRLNPNIPWKTRGNAALALRLGHGRGPPRVVGKVRGESVRAYPSGRALSTDESDRFLDTAWQAVLANGRAEPGTDPAIVAVRDRLPARLYWKAVRDRVYLAEVERELRASGARYRVRAGRRGLIGASAALAWPARRATWELIAYRQPGRYGTPREVDADSVRAAQQQEPELFLCEDPRTRRLLVAPHTACPILFGLRATSPDAPVRALPTVRSEAVDRWMLFRTNQGTGDHLRPRTVRSLTGYRSGSVRATVERGGEVRAGGHVRFAVRDRAGGRLLCLAFEPTKTLPAVARALRPGDRVRVWGSRGRGGTLRLEGIELIAAAPRGRWRPPRCEACGQRSRSLGRGRGWRCDGCRRRFPPEAGGREERPPALVPGIYHPTPSARRHLAPLGPEGYRQLMPRAA